jgi:ubiquinone/menaquinone biosynthesis C-methylase UbiE
MKKIIFFGFHLLYTTFAWVYDLVAYIVSFGEWKDWAATALVFLSGNRVLELAHGPGHVHFVLHQRKYATVGIDLSAEMGQITYKRLKTGQFLPKLARAQAQYLPFANAVFDHVVSTFPTRFIVSPLTLAEIYRVLTANGTCVVVPNAQLVGTGLSAQFVRWLYKITGQHADDGQQWAELFKRHGFAPMRHFVALRHAVVEVWVLAKQGASPTPPPQYAAQSATDRAGAANL